MLSLCIYTRKPLLKDVDLCNVTPVNTAIISYGGTSIYLSSGKFICVYGMDISDACLTAIWLTARKSDLFLAGKCAWE